MGIIRNTYHPDSFANAVYLFCGRKTSTLKALHFEKTGFVLLYKRLDEGRFQWSGNSIEARSLTRQEFRWLMEGLSIDQPKAIRPSAKRDFMIMYKTEKFKNIFPSVHHVSDGLSTQRRPRQNAECPFRNAFSDL